MALGPWTQGEPQAPERGELTWSGRSPGVLARAWQHLPTGARDVQTRSLSSPNSVGVPDGDGRVPDSGAAT